MKSSKELVTMLTDDGASRDNYAFAFGVASTVSDHLYKAIKEISEASDLDDAKDKAQRMITLYAKYFYNEKTI